MIKESDKFINSSIFEGMTSISSLIKSIKNGHNDRKINKILFDESKTKSKYKELSFLRSVSKELSLISKCVTTILLIAFQLEIATAVLSLFAGTELLNISRKKS